MLIQTHMGSLSYLKLLLAPLPPLSAYRLNCAVHLLIADQNLMEGESCLSNKMRAYTALVTQLVHILYSGRFGSR